MSSSRSSKSRKAEGLKETVNGNDGDSEIEEIEINSDSEGGESSASDYKPKKPRECSINKAAFSMPDDIKKLMERVTCCSCGKQLNPMNPGAVRKHPWLKVITCKKCYKFLRSGPFTRDDDGLDEQCRWCGEGGRLYGCDYCHNCFCRTCIKRNMGRSEAAVMENDDNSKWHCYMCKPKKISKLVDDCEKILGYIEKEEKKEKEREERAKQREKEKAEKYKEKRRDEKSKKSEEKEFRKEERDKKEDKDENSTPKRGFPAPRDKSVIAEKISSDKKDVEKSKGSIPQTKSQADLIVVEDSPIPTFGPLQKHHRAVEYKPDAKSGVTLVQKASNGVTEVHVGPKNDKVVVVPIVNRSAGRAPNPQVMTYINKPLLAGMLTQQTTKIFDRGLVKIMAQQNDIKALKNNIMPYNIENITERMATIAQSLSLTLNSAKTDLAIAKLSQTNMHSARQTAAAVVKNGFEYFFSQVREVFNVQVVTNFPQMNAPDLNAQGDVKTVSGHLTSTPNAKKEPQSLLFDTVTGVLNESAIPIEIDETSPVKKPGHMKEKMEVDVDDDSVVYVTDNESKEVKTVPLKDEKEEKEENVLPEDVKDQASDLLKGDEEDQAKKNETSDKDVKGDNSEGEVKAAANDETADTEDEIVAVSEAETETRRSTRNANKVNGKEYSDKKDEEKVNEESDIEEQGKVTRRSRSVNKVNDKEQRDKKDEEKVNDDSDIEEQGKVTRRSRSVNKVNDKEQRDKKDEEKVNEDSDIEEQGKVTRKSRSGNKVNDKEQNKKEDEEKVNEDSDIEEQGKVTRRSRNVNKVNDKEQKDKEDEENFKEDSDDEEKGKVTRRSRSANKVNEKDKKDKVEDVDKESEEIEDHKQVEKKTNTSKSSKKGADKDEEQDKNKTVDEENENIKKSDKKGKNNSFKSSDGEKSDENKKDKEEKNEVDMDQSENTAAELELLKEMEEEFNAESDEPRRSLRRRKKDESESKEGSDNDSPVRRSSRQRQKPDEGKETDKGDKKKADSDSKKKKDKDESVEKDFSKDKKKKKVLEESDDDKTEENDDFDDDTSRASSVKDKKNSKSPKKSVNKSKLYIESEESDEAPKGKSKKDTKASKNEKEEKSSKKDQKVDDDDIPMEESDTTETSDSDGSVAEFGKVKRRRKPVAKEETSRTTRQRGKKSEPSEPSDSDSDFDKDLEKEIKSLSKETRLTKKKEKEAKETKSETKGKKEKPKEKEKEDKKKGKKDDDEDDDDDSDSSDDEPQILSGAEDDSSDEDTDKVSASQLKKLKQTGKAILEDDSDEDYVDQNNISDDSSDPEVSFPKLSTPKKGKRAKSEDQSDDSDFITPKKKRQRVKDKLLDVKVSDSDSDTGKKGKKGKGKKGKGKRKKDDSDQFSELSDEDENKPKGKGKKRKRIRKIDSSDEEGAPKEPGEDDNVGSDEEDDGTPGGFLKRKQIRKVKSTKKLAETTKAAQKAEEDRRKRIEERQKEYNTYVEVEGGEEEEEVPEGTEREMTTPTKAPDSIAKILGSPRKIPVTTKCVLEMDKETKKPLIEVDKTLIRKLKPHQVEAVRFMYNCCVESIERLKKGDGSGCILAHCMGLGKTLSVISFVHTMLRNVKLTKMTKCLVVCPLNTVLNWVNEFEIWLDDVDFEIEVYEMSRVKQNFERAQMLKEWHEGGAGVMILGYDMYRNLVNGSHCKNKKQKKIFYDSLADPGPDIVVCDEGHILKNDATSLSKAMSKIKSPRRIVLTGTPLQNNLGEYHCMVSFVKPSLLGTRKEFNNRFNNPITNGQCSDSTAFDVKLMKRRAHILHELLAGCVQRKDYSALTKYLPPKFEYVISVRLSKVQMTLYEKYLDMVLGGGGVEGVKYKGARLFTDYQALMRIWTHPWVLKLDEIRQENKRMFDDEDEDSFIDDSNSEDDSFIDDDSTTSESNDDVDYDSDASKKKKGKGKSKKKKRKNKKGSSSSDEDSKKEKDKDTGDEVVKKWTSKRRGNEEGAGSSWMIDMGYGNPDEGPKEVTSEWWAEFVKEGDEFKLELSGKLTLMFEILKMCEDIGDKVLVFSQSLLSLDIIEDFLSKIDEANQEITNADKPATVEEKPKEDADKPKENGEAKADGEKSATEKTEKEKLNERLSHYGKSWSKGADYFRMDGSTNSQNRKAAQDMFNDPENYRARLFLISTKAGSLGINLVAANRVIIFDASWNPSHDIQSIFRVYRFGQVKPVYVYRFLAQGTMEAKIYERQVTKQSLSQRVVDEHQIERHFTANDLQELYKFTPDRLDDPNIKERPLLALPKDHMLAELMTHNKEWIVSYHEHDSLLENVTEQELTEEEKKAAWEDYEDEKKGISRAMGGMNMNINPGLYATQQMNMQNLLLQGQANLGQAAVLQIVQDLKARFPNLPPEVFQQRVQAVLRQVLTQQIMAQSEMQRRQVEAQRMAELQRLNQIKQQIQRQQAMINSQQRSFGMAGMNPTMNFGMSGAAGGMQMTRSLLNPMTTSHSNMPRPPSSASIAPRLPDQNKK